jgi:hypothetical protein
MKPDQMIPFYTADGKSLGFRTIDAARRLLAGGSVTGSYGRRKNLRAIWLRNEDGSHSAQIHLQPSLPYSFIERLDHGRCWNLRRLDRRDEDGVPVSTRDAFFKVVTDCLVPFRR